MKKLHLINALLIIFLLIILGGCSKTITDHDLRVAAKKIIRKQLVSPATATFAPDNEVKISREEDKTFRISLYSDDHNKAGEVIRQNWNLHLKYNGGSLKDINNWKVLQK